MARPSRRIARPAGVLRAVLTLAGAGFAAASSTSAQGPTAPPPGIIEGSLGFNPYAFIGLGNAFNCATFKSPAEAQAVLRADAADPNRLDTDRPRPDGIAFEHNLAPYDLAPVPRG